MLLLRVNALQPCIGEREAATRRRFRARALLPPGCPASVSESEE